MNEISGVWSLAALLLFGGALTAVAAGAAIFLAENWFQKMQRRAQFKIDELGLHRFDKVKKADAAAERAFTSQSPPGIN